MAMRSADERQNAMLSQRVRSAVHTGEGGKREGLLADDNKDDGERLVGD